MDRLLQIVGTVYYNVFAVGLISLFDDSFMRTVREAVIYTSVALAVNTLPKLVKWIIRKVKEKRNGKA